MMQQFSIWHQYFGNYAVLVKTAATENDYPSVMKIYDDSFFKGKFHIATNTVDPGYNDIGLYQGCAVGTQNLRFRPLHKSSICINNGKPVRHFIATT
jgi:hypothetical protein